MPQHRQSISVGDATDEHYSEVLALLQAAREQAASIRRGEGQSECAVCGDGGHTCEECHHNPLLLTLMGREAMVGCVWRCFHCGAVYTDEDSARRHFGSDVDEIALCLQLRMPGIHR